MEPTSREPEELLDALDGVISGARPARFGRGVLVDYKRTDALLDELRIWLPETVFALRWYRLHREEEGDPPLGHQPEWDADEILGSIYGLHDLLYRARPSLLDAGRPRVDERRLVEAVGRIRSWMAPQAQELAAYRRLYPGLRQRWSESAIDDQPELARLIDQAQELRYTPRLIPLTLQVRIDPAAVHALTAQMRSALARDRDITESAALPTAIDSLDALVERAKAIPLTDDVRIEYEEIYDVLDLLQAAYGDARLESCKPTEPDPT